MYKRQEPERPQPLYRTVPVHPFPGGGPRRRNRQHRPRDSDFSHGDGEHCRYAGGVAGSQSLSKSCESSAGAGTRGPAPGGAASSTATVTGPYPFQGYPSPPYSVSKFLSLMDLEHGRVAKILRTLELAAESSQERTYGGYTGETSALPALSPHSLCKKPRK